MTEGLGLRSIIVLLPLTLLPLPRLQDECVVLRAWCENDLDDRLEHPIDPEEEDAYGSEWRRGWDGRRWHTREHLAARAALTDGYRWAIEHQSRCIGNAELRVNVNQHRATYSIGIFDRSARGHGLGRATTRLIVRWGFDELQLHRIQLEVLASNLRAINCYLACGFEKEGTRREAELYPDGWKDFILMAQLATRTELR